MNWFKKFIDWLNGEDVVREYELEIERASQSQDEQQIPLMKTKTIENEHIHHIHRFETKNNLHEMKSNRNVETRVKFQYPKSQFRFPVVPDIQVKKTQEERPKTIKPQQQHYSRSFANEKPTVVKTIKKKEPQQEWTRKIEPKAKQPFKPTAIPSPIYGFNNRPMKEKKTEVTEFELRNGMFEGFPLKKPSERVQNKTLNPLVKQTPINKENMASKQALDQEKASPDVKIRPVHASHEKTVVQHQSLDTGKTYDRKPNQAFTWHSSTQGKGKRIWHSCQNNRKTRNGY